MDLCPCGSQKVYGECCEPFIKKTAMPQTAEQVMRCRYTAYAKTEVKYIIESSLPKDQKDCDEKAIKKWSEGSTWHSLEIVSTDKGGPSDNEGMVEFIATYTENRIRKKLHEKAKFQKLDGIWYYADSEIQPVKQFIRTDEKINRNDPCTCGSGKKFKKCCGV